MECYLEETQLCKAKVFCIANGDAVGAEGGFIGSLVMVTMSSCLFGVGLRLGTIAGFVLILCILFQSFVTIQALGSSLIEVMMNSTLSSEILTSELLDEVAYDWTLNIIRRIGIAASDWRSFF